MSRPLPPPPRTLDELLDRAEHLAGRTLADVARLHAARVPEDLRRAKGWIGQLLESALGATASSRAEPDFPGLGVEMKSIPVDARGRPRESTYVCTAPIDGSMATRWEDSWVRHKLSCVLWVPIVGEGDVGGRIVGSPLLWRPSEQEDRDLRADWEELVELIDTGQHWQIDARRGRFLQLRPKAASSAETSWALDAEGQWVRANPLGFYLRTRFTRALLERAFLLP